MERHVLAVSTRLLLLLILLNIVSDSLSQVASRYAEITGTVVDENGRPVPGATVNAVPVNFGGASGDFVTDEKGYFRALVAPGREYEISAGKELAYYLSPGIMPFGFKTGGKKNPIVDLRQTHKYEGAVVQFNPPLGGIKVITFDDLDSRILRSKIQVFRGSLDPKKKYPFTFTEQNYCKPLLLPAGHYNVRLSHEGYEPVQFSADVEPRKSSLFMIPLVKSKGTAYQR